MAKKELTLGQLAALADAAAKKVDPTLDVKLRTLGQAGVGHMKQAIQAAHAVDTGTMVNSTSMESVGDTILIGPTVTYAPFVALGTDVMPARPFHLVAKRKIAADIKTFLKPEDLGL
jgi:phage gpG-like protein